MDFQSEVEIPRCVVAFGHFGYFLYTVLEVIGNLAVHVLQFHMAEHHETHVQLVGVDDGGVFLDVTLPLKPFQTLKNGGCAQVHLLCQLTGGQFGVFLQRTQNIQVGCV